MLSVWASLMAVKGGVWATWLKLVAEPSHAPKPDSTNPNSHFSKQFATLIQFWNFWAVVILNFWNLL